MADRDPQGADYQPYGKAMRWQLPIARALAWTFLMVLGPFRVFGRERIPKTGGLLILCNHLSDCDPLAVHAGCKRPIRFMAKSELFGIPFVRTVLRWIKAFPVKRGEPDKGAIRQAVRLLQAGECVCVFPEGQLSETGQLQELRPGVALIVRMAAAPVICCRLRNTNRVIPYGTVIPRPAFAWVSASWGEPRSFERHAGAEEIIGWATGQLSSL